MVYTDWTLLTKHHIPLMHSSTLNICDVNMHMHMHVHYVEVMHKHVHVNAYQSWIHMYVASGKKHLWLNMSGYLQCLNQESKRTYSQNWQPKSKRTYSQNWQPIIQEEVLTKLTEMPGGTRRCICIKKGDSIKHDKRLWQCVENFWECLISQSCCKWIDSV